MVSDFPLVFAFLSPTVVALLELIPLTAAVVFYWHRAMTLSWAGRPVPVWRQISFGFGLLLAAFVLFNPWGYIAEELVIGHMIEHLIIGDIASIFIVLGLTRSMLQPVLAIRKVRWLQILSNPFVALPLWAINLFFWHIPAVYDTAYGGALIHGVEHSAFLIFGCIVWLPVLGPLPTPNWFGPGWKVVYVVIVRFVAGILGNILMWTQFTLYHRYAEGQEKWGISAVQDQSTAGAIMMVEGMFLILGILAWTYFKAAKQSIQKQDLMDLALTHGVQLDEERITRAVKAGHADLLEKRILAGKAEAGGDPE